MWANRPLDYLPLFCDGRCRSKWPDWSCSLRLHVLERLRGPAPPTTESHCSQVLKECKSTDDLKDFLEKPKTEPGEAEKPYLHLFVFRRRKDGADELWTTEEDFKGLSDIAGLGATAEWFPISVYNKAGV